LYTSSADLVQVSHKTHCKWVLFNISVLPFENKWRFIFKWQMFHYICLCAHKSIKWTHFFPVYCLLCHGSIWTLINGASLQWAVLLFNVFSDCSAHETLEKYLSKKYQLTKNSRQCKLWKIVSNLAALFSFLQRMPVYSSQPHFHTCHGAALNKVYS